MWLQKRINKRLIKRAIGSEYVYQIEADEKIRRFSNEENKSGGLTWFIKGWVDEMKKEIKKKMDE